MKKPAPWRPPTRRSFVAMLGAIAAAVTAKEVIAPSPVVPKKPRWIGHC